MALINSQRLQRFMCTSYVKISEKCYPTLGKYADLSLIIITKTDSCKFFPNFGPGAPITFLRFISHSANTVTSI